MNKTIMSAVIIWTLYSLGLCTNVGQTLIEFEKTDPFFAFFAMSLLCGLLIGMELTFQKKTF